MTEFKLPVRVYYEDTDAGGVVYHARYLHFLERGRTEALREIGHEQDQLLQQGLVFAVHHLDINFRAPARFNDELIVTTTISRLKAASLDFNQQIHRQRGQQLLSVAEVKVACLAHPQFKPSAIPKAILGDLRQHA